MLLSLSRDLYIVYDIVPYTIAIQCHRLNCCARLTMTYVVVYVDYVFQIVRSQLPHTIYGTDANISEGQQAFAGRPLRSIIVHGRSEGRQTAGSNHFLAELAL